MLFARELGKDVMYELIIRPEAEAEINDAFTWYEEQVSGLGADFILNLDATFHKILRNPL